MEDVMPDTTIRFMDTFARDMAEGKAAIEELKHLKTLISYWIHVDPMTGDMTIKLSRNARIEAKDFQDMVFNYSTRE